MDVIAKVKALKHQIEFSRNNERFCALVGGYGSGKSEGAVYRALTKLKQRKYAVYVLIAPTYGLLADVNIPDFERLLNHYCIRYHHVKKDRRFIVNSGNFTGEIWFRSADRPERIVGFDATDANLEEFDILPPTKQKEVWRKTLARLRGDSDATLTVTTTPEGFRETYNLFEKEKVGPIIRAKTTDNHFLPADYVKSLYDQYDERLVEQYINAKFVNINNMAAYYAFDREKHHERLKIDQIDAYPWIGAGWDFNVNKMAVQCFVFDEGTRKMHFFDEIILQNYHGKKPVTQAACDILKDKFPDKQIRAFPDATGKSKSSNATKSDIDIIRQNNIQVYARNSNPFVRDRLNAVNGGYSQGRITIDTDKCKDLTEDLEQNVKNKYGEIDKSDLTKTHSGDAAGYPVAWLMPVKRPVQDVRRSA